MNIRLSLFGYEILDLSVGREAEGGYFVLGGDFEVEEQSQATYGFALDKNKE